MAGDDRGPVLDGEHLTQPRHVVRQAREGELRSRHVVAGLLNAPNDTSPTGAVCPRTVDQNNVHPHLPPRSGEPLAKSDWTGSQLVGSTTAWMMVVNFVWVQPDRSRFHSAPIALMGIACGCRIRRHRPMRLVGRR